MTDGVFRFSSPGLEIEFEGPESFVEGQIARIEGRILRELGIAPTEQPAADPPGLAEFTERARTREGRGALQETILIFAYYLARYREAEHFTIEDIRKAVRWVHALEPPRPALEITGGVTLERVEALAATGVRRLSTGAITHSARALDISLKIRPSTS